MKSLQLQISLVFFIIVLYHSVGRQGSFDIDATHALMPSTNQSSAIAVCTVVNGFLFYDENCDGVMDSIENGVNGMAVELYQIGDSLSRQIFHTTLMPGSPSTDGYFEFCVAPGNYIIEVDLVHTQLVASLKDVNGNLPLNDINEDSFDSDLNRISQHICRTDTFTVNTTSFHDNIGLGTCDQAVVGNRVWFDDNYNGIQEKGENGVNDVVVELFDYESGLKMDEAITDSLGLYSFEYLQSKDYYLRFIPSTYYIFCPDNQGPDSLDSNVDHSNGFGTTPALNMNAGLFNNSIDAGLQFVVLPLTWESFNVQRLNDSYNRLSWTVSQEINTSHFIIERKINNDIWQILSRVEAEGRASHTMDYHYDDRQATLSGTYVYRIKQYDLDGKYIYSNAVNMSIGANLKMDLFPNPSSDEVNIRFSTDDATLLSVNVYDHTGALVIANALKEVLTAGDLTRSIGISHLPKGIYTFDIQLGATSTQRRVVVVD